MKKVKIAISLDNSLLELVDSKIDGSFIRSRSQSIEHYLGKGLKEDIINTAVIFLKGEHQEYSLKEISGRKLINRQLDLLRSALVNKVFIVTQHTSNTENLKKELKMFKLNALVVEKEVHGTAAALYSIKEELKKGEFIALSGDIYNNFSLRKMIKKHQENNKAATIGLISKKNIENAGSCILDGDYVISFKEKEKTPQSNIANAGIYIFSGKIFSFINKNTVSLETDVFPRLAEAKELIGFFTHGEYLHMEEQ